MNLFVTHIPAIKHRAVWDNPISAATYFLGGKNMSHHQIIPSLHSYDEEMFIILSEDEINRLAALATEAISDLRSLNVIDLSVSAQALALPVAPLVRLVVEDDEEFRDTIPVPADEDRDTIPVQAEALLRESRSSFPPAITNAGWDAVFIAASNALAA